MLVPLSFRSSCRSLLQCSTNFGNGALGGAKSPAAERRAAILDEQQPKVTRMSGVLIGTLCGIAAAIAWAAGFVVAKHGISIGFSPADLALHRFLWSGLLLMPLVLRDGIRDLGGIGWGRGLVVWHSVGPGAGAPCLYGLHPGSAWTRHRHSAGNRRIDRNCIGCRHAARKAFRIAHFGRRCHHRRTGGVWL